MTATAQQIDPEIRAHPESLTGQLREKYQHAYDFIKANALKGKKFEEAADLIRISKYHFHRRFHHLFKITPKQLQSQVQIEAVKEMMLKGIPLVQVAKDCGFAHQSHMNSRFKQAVKSTPMQWLRAEQVRLKLEAQK